MGAVRQGRALGQSSKQASKRADRQTDDFGPGSGERCRAESSAIQGQNVRHAKGAAAQRTWSLRLDHPHRLPIRVVEGLTCWRWCRHWLPAAPSV